ncbi:V-type ATP synthase subunit A, partial [candidate division KSB1 bacterium]|nr:V-type ATP synthase subunit A [candidate division KSB1 bacterium]
PLDSWSKYDSLVPAEMVDLGREFLFKGNEVHQMMMVVGEEGTSQKDFLVYLKSEFLDGVYLQQNAFDPVDAATSPERQRYVFEKLVGILQTDFEFEDKEQAREFFYDLRQKFIDWNYIPMDSDDFKKQEKAIDDTIKMVAEHEKSL